MEMANNKNDFVLDSKGLCFFCLDKNFPIKHEQESATFPKYPLYYLSHYLKMDMRKVFSDMEQIPSHLLAKVESSRLKVGLCEECVCLNETFSETYRKLEKMEIELGSCLERIHAKLLDSSETCNPKKFKKLTNVQPRLKWSSDGELEILEVLREEAFQKSNHKLRADVPRVKFHNLTKKEVIAKTQCQKFKVVPSEQQETLLPSECKMLSSPKPGYKSKADKIKLETQDFLADDDNCPSDDFEAHDDSIREDLEDTNLTMENQNDRNYIGSGPTVSPSLVTTEIQLKSSSKFGTKPAWTIIPGTGKYKCDTFSMELADKGAVQQHYKSVHLKVRFKCDTCGKQDE